MTNTCHCCRGKYFKSNCFFKDKNCYECNRVEHKATYLNRKKKCKKRTYRNLLATWCKVEDHKEKINKTSNVSLSEQEMSQKRKFVLEKINDIKIKLQLDTGSDITIINETEMEKMGKHSLFTSKTIANGFSKTKLNFLMNSPLKVFGKI